MDPQQRQWMAQEIARWRKNRLLPAAYCNFLAQLYDVPLDVQEGGGSNETVGSWADRIASLRPMTWLVFFIIFVLFCIIGIHFTAFASPMQISVIAAPVLVLAALAWPSRKTNLRRSRWLAFLACLTLSGGGWLVLQDQGWRAWWPTVVWLVVSALLWLLCGLLARSGLMQGAGWLHAAAAYGCGLQIAMTDLTLGNSQWLWLPESGLFVWLAWAVHRLSPRASAGLLIASAGLWFMPEAAWAAARPWSQLEADQEMLSFLLGKWIMLWCSAFYFRKQWVKWIRENQTVQAAAADR